MNDSSRKTRPKSQVMMPNSSTSPIPSHSRKNGSSDSLPSHRYENEWEMRKKELAELKARSAQMEKTMRWWSDCTDNWRKKWSEVKTERNQAREELKATKLQLSQVLKQLDGSQARDINKSKIAQADVRIYSNIEQPPPPLPRSTSVAGSTKKAYSQQPHPPAQNNKCNLTDNGILYKPSFAFPQSSKHKYDTEHQNPNGQRHFQSSKTKVTRRVQTDLSGSGISVLDRELVSLLEEKVSHLKFKFDEVTTRLAIERQEKAHLIQRVERLQRELGDLSDLYESVKKELCEINGKEFTESEIESFADDREDIEDLLLESDAEESRLIEQLAHDDDEEVDDHDKHTPTQEMDVNKCDFPGTEEGANGDGDGSSDTSSIKDTNSKENPSIEASPQSDRKFTQEQDDGCSESLSKDNGISEKNYKPLNESLSIDEDIERKVQLLNGQLKAINFQEENHEKLDLRCFWDLTEPIKVNKVECEVVTVKNMENNLVSIETESLTIISVDDTREQVPNETEIQAGSQVIDENNVTTIKGNNAEEVKAIDLEQKSTAVNEGDCVLIETVVSEPNAEIHLESDKVSPNGDTNVVDDSMMQNPLANIPPTDI